MLHDFLIKFLITIQHVVQPLSATSVFIDVVAALTSETPL